MAKIGHSIAKEIARELRSGNRLKTSVWIELPKGNFLEFPAEENARRYCENIGFDFTKVVRRDYQPAANEPAEES